MRAGDSPPSQGGTAGRFDRGEGVGEYRFIVELARGDTGIVYLAVGALPGDRVLAIRELRHELLDNEAAVTSFLDEARVAARLSHPNLVQAIEVGRDGARRFLVTEHVDGQLLQRVVRRAHRLAPAMPLRMHVRVVTEVLAALEYAHALADLDGTPLGLVHRHVSPQSVCITYEGHVKLLDFGIAPARGHSRDGRADAGKLSCVAPECLYGKDVDGRADIFAVGAMLYEAILWSGPAGIKQGGTALHGPSDPALLAIVQRAMSGDPDARYPTARAMREDLERYASRSNVELPDAGELSDLVSSLFAQEHQRQQALIEERLRALDDPSGSEPSLGALPQFVLTPTPPPASRVQPISAPPVAAPPAPARTRSSIGFGMAIGVGAVLAAGSVVLLTVSQSRPPTTLEVPVSAPARTPSADPVQVAPVEVSPAQPSPVQTPPAQAPRVEAKPVQAIVAQAAPAHADRPAARIYAPPPPRSHPSPVVAAPARPTGDEPSTRAPSPPISAIDLPLARPVREIRKENPYLQ